MALALDKDLERDQETVPTLNALAPTPHPPVIVPAEAFPAAAHPLVLGFAPAPVVSLEPAVPLKPAVLVEPAAPDVIYIPAPRVRPRGRLHLSWYEAAIIALILGCGALCVYRLFWAMQV